MGGGFGGCTVNLIKSNEIPDVVSKIKERYKSNFGINLKATIAKPGSGIKVLEIKLFYPFGNKQISFPGTSVISV